jgi:type II secretory pathway component HofQ
MKVSKTWLRLSAKRLLIVIVCSVLLCILNSPGVSAGTQNGNKEEKKVEKKKTENKKDAKRTSGNDGNETPSKYTGERGDFIFNNADIKNVILFFAKTYKLNVVLDPGISGKVDCRLINVPWDQALDLILIQQGLAAIKEKSSSDASLTTMKVKKL